MDRVIGGVVARPRSVVSLALAIIGVYGVVSYMAATRSKEMAIRVAVGSTARGITLLIPRNVLSLLLVATGAGVPLTVLCGTLFARLLYGIAPTGPATFALIVALLILVTLMAAWLPARRVGRLDPMSTLRSDKGWK